LPSVLGLLLVGMGGLAAWLYRELGLARAGQAKAERQIAIFAHAIRSPLNAIYGYAQLLERGHDMAPSEAGQIIRRSCEQLTGLVEGLQHEGAAIAPRLHEGKPVAYNGAQHAVLVIDDDLDQLRLLRSFLVPLGFAVYEARDGREGLALAKQHWPDLVLLDVSMPGLSGWDVARNLRDMLGGALRIIMVSGEADEAHIGAHDLFLRKPVRLDGLLEAVGAVLQLPTNAEARALPARAAPYLTEIEAHLRIGHVRGIAAGLQDLGQAVPEAAGVMPELLAMLERCDMVGLGAAIRGLR
jgi:CheY-like chemotaxis protein